MRVLVVEDDAKLQSILRAHIKKDGYVVEGVATLAEASARLIEKNHIDLVLLDVMLPDGSGVDFCKDLRASNNRTPVLMLTSRNSTLDAITGLDAGADDYMPKPFSPNELSARIRSLLRRPPERIPQLVKCGDITVDMLARTVHSKRGEVPLMPKEFSLLEYLVRRKNEVIKKEELLRNVWGVYSRTSSNRLEVYVRYLREKLNPVIGAATIKTVRGMGYMIADD